jgi:hypothetical protein
LGGWCSHGGDDSRKHAQHKGAGVNKARSSDKEERWNVLADKAERDLFRRRILDDLARLKVLKVSTIGCRMILVRGDERIRGLAGEPRPSE